MIEVTHQPMARPMMTEIAAVTAVTGLTPHPPVACGGRPSGLAAGENWMNRYTRMRKR
jgi:hypothetical protein